MRCSRCSKESGNDAAFCQFCGAPFGPDSVRRLQRVTSRGKVAGVCAGLAAYLRLDVTIVRLGWIVLSVVPGAIIGGVLVYAVAWAVMPAVETTGEEPPPVDRLFRSDNDRKVAGVCGGIAQYLRVDSNLVRLTFFVLTIYPGAIIFGVLVYIVAWVVMPLEPGPELSPATP
jgi:phage shock protein PspC (stress-responsive transcriptional regulator)